MLGPGCAWRGGQSNDVFGKKEDPNDSEPKVELGCPMLPQVCIVLMPISAATSVWWAPRNTCLPVPEPSDQEARGAASTRIFHSRPGRARPEQSLPTFFAFFERVSVSVGEFLTARDSWYRERDFWG
jgi:hypothetical protein